MICSRDGQACIFVDNQCIRCFTLQPRGHREGWRKILYIKQDYPDNHVDSSFLELMRKNANVRAYEYWSVVVASGAILQHVSTIVAFLAIFMLLYYDRMSHQWLIVGGSLLTVCGYAYWDWTIGALYPQQRLDRWEILKSAALLFGFLYGLSPILMTLTRATSSDTIWSLTVICFIVNLLSNDYSSDPDSFQFSAVSTNAAIFASVMLASRLPQEMDLFALTLLAVECFALFPVFRCHFVGLSTIHHNGMTAVLFTASVLLMMYAHLPAPIVALYVFGAAVLTFVCPWWLISMQKYKKYPLHCPITPLVRSVAPGTKPNHSSSSPTAFPTLPSTFNPLSARVSR
jgi:phosphatidylinositol glycan class C protein